MISDHPFYLLTAASAVLLALLFPVTRDIQRGRHRRQYYFLQVVTILGAIAGAKFSVLFGDAGWPLREAPDWRELLWSGRSITGALILGFLAAEVAKPIIGYPMPPNDRFAAVLPFSIGLGRVGCLVSGCCGGVPWNGWCAIHDHDGVLRHPTQAYEMLFQFGIGVLFLFLVKRGLLFGHLFSIYLMGYGTFRFFTEFLRDTPKFFGALSGYQVLALVMLVLGACVFIKRKLAPPPDWDEFRPGNTLRR